MTRTELDKVSARVSGMIHLVDMLTQITRAMHCPLVRPLADRPKGLDALYNFFANGPGDPPVGHYLWIDEKTDPALAAYDTINLVYGYCAGVQAGERYTCPFIKCADRRYALLMYKTCQPDHLHSFTLHEAARNCYCIFVHLPRRFYSLKFPVPNPVYHTALENI